MRVPAPVLTRLRFRWRGNAPLTVFSYHAVVAHALPVPNFCYLPLEIFRRQAQVIAERYDILPLEEAVGRLWNGTLRHRTAALAFDDGFRSNHDVAMPVLRQVGLPATLFLCTAPATLGGTLWFARLHRAVCLTSRAEVEWQGRRYGLRGSTDRANTSARWQASLKRLPPADLEKACDELCRTLEVEDGNPGDPDFGMVDEKMLAAMGRSGLFTFGAHTRSHAVLSQLSREDQRAEIAGSVEDITNLTGRRPRLFAYPYGSAQDFNAESEAILEELGLQAAFTTVEAGCRTDDARFRLPGVLLGSEFWKRRAG